MPRKSTHKLDSFLPRLGKEPDHKIAIEAGVSRSLVISFRKKHNIDAYEGYKFGADNPPPAARAAAAAAKAPQAAPAKAAPAAPAKAAAAAPAKAAAVAPPKAAAAKPAPAAPAPVKVEPAADLGAGFRGRKSALDAYVEMLGKLPDAEIAKLAHVTPENVRTYRTRRGIEANWPEASKARVGRPPGPAKRAAAAPLPPAPVAVAPAPVAVAPAPVAVAPAPAAKAAPPKAAPAPGETRSIFSVSVDIGGAMRTYAVAASNINDGVVSANALVQRRHPNGIVKGISFVAELLG